VNANYKWMNHLNFYSPDYHHDLGGAGIGILES
jgi:hypothetical protein